MLIADSFKMIKVKVCGITNLEDALMAIDAGADMLGFVFAESPRQRTPEQVFEITARLPPGIEKVGVFVNSEVGFVKRVMAACHLDKAQLHGDETPEYCQAIGPSRVIKAFRVRDRIILDVVSLYQVATLLLDSYDPARAGGTGQTFNWAIAREAKKYGKIILSGGLNPGNVQEAISVVAPYAVDVSSGVEARPGKKDPIKTRAFIAAVK